MEQYRPILIIAGVSLFTAILWAVSVAIAYWDLHRRNLSGIEVFAWLALVALLPFIGFGAFLFARLLSSLFSPPHPEILPEGRSTALKRPALPPEGSATIYARDLSKEMASTRAPAGANPAVVPIRQEPLLPIHYQLFVLEGPLYGKKFPLATLPASIGRGREAAIRLDQDLAVSRNHAEIFEKAGALHIRDLSSAHGTKVNGARIEEQQLNLGDQIRVGLTILEVKPEGDEG